MAAVERIDGKGCSPASPPAYHGNTPVLAAVKGTIDATNISTFKAVKLRGQRANGKGKDTTYPSTETQDCCC
jgi:hypothetical protein